MRALALDIEGRGLIKNIGRSLILKRRVRL